MLARYRIVRGKRPPDDPLPDGERQDTRKHTKHCLRPDENAVFRFLASPSEAAWKTFRSDYLGLLASRFKEDREPFDALADLARETDVYIGCNCPTTKNPDVQRCHTVLALAFMQQRYSDLKIVLPNKDLA